MKIASLKRCQILKKCIEFSSTEQAFSLVTFNSLMALEFWKNTGFRDAVNSADLVVCDSVGIQVLSLLAERRIIHRYPGIEIIGDIVKRGVESFFWGGEPGVAARAAEKISEKYRLANICGVSDGYFLPGEENNIIKEINRLKPRVLFVGLDMPRQEIFIKNIKDRLDVGLVMGVGGSFDVISGSLSRAPAIFSFSGTEWFWRLMLQPWRLWRILSLWVFVVEALWRFFKGKSILE